MVRIVASLLLLFTLLAASVPSVSQAPFAAGVQPAPARKQLGGLDPLAAPRRIRALLAERNLPAMGPARRAIPPLLRPRVVPGQYIVRYRTAASKTAFAAAHAQVRARVVSEIPRLNIQTVELPRVEDVELYRKDSNVLWIEPNAMRYPLVTDPNDPAFSQLDSGLPSDPFNATWFKWDAHLIQGVEGWSIWPGKYFLANAKGTAAVKLAIIDTGVDYNHPDFANAGNTSTLVPYGQLFQSLDRTMFNGTTSNLAWDVYGHGTHVTGIAAAGTNNSVGVTGNGYNANVISIRVTDDQGNGTSSDLARAILYAADSGAIVCNISLGDYGYSQAEQDAINYAWNKGMLVVAAAGNDGGGGSAPPYIYPAALSKVLAVSATSREENLASYSSYGDDVGICAPGGDWDFTIEWFLGIYSTTPTYTVTLNDPLYGMANNYDYLQGTSMASPQVAGLAALYAGMKGYTQATPGAPLQIWRAIQKGAEGNGGWSPYFGWGRINVYNTMNIANVPNPRGETIGCITGQVRYKGTVVQNATIDATPTGGGLTFSASSRADGGYRIPNMPVGSYNVVATYFGETQTISNVQVVAGCDTPGMDFNIGVAPPPAAPTNLTATAGDTQVSLSWTASSGATSYNVKRSTTSGNGYTTVKSGATTTGFTNTGLTNGTKYYYVVTAVNAGGESANSNEAFATPAAPSGTTVRLNSGGPLFNASTGVFSADQYFTGGATTNRGNIAIANTSDAALYQTLRYGPTFGYSIPIANGTYTLTLHFAETGLNSGNSRLFNVSVNGSAWLTNLDVWTEANGAKRALLKSTSVTVAAGKIDLSFVSVKGTNAFVNAVEIVASGAVSPPVAPTNLTATPGDTQAALSWTASSGATSYNVKRSTTSGSGYTTVKSGATTTGFTNTGLTNGTKYYYVVTAVNAGGESANSNEAFATPAAPSGTTVRLNSGGPLFNASTGVFSADQYFTGGATTNRGNIAIANTADAALYQTLRYNPSFGYSIPAPNGTYTLTLHFAETSYNSAGARRFNVSVNGSAWLSALDVWSEAGGINKALKKSTTVTVTNGKVDIAFGSVNSVNAFVNAIELVPSGP